MPCSTTPITSCVPSSCGAASSVIGPEQLSTSLLPAISELAHDRQWRVRMAIIEALLDARKNEAD